MPSISDELKFSCPYSDPQNPRKISTSKILGYTVVPCVQYTMVKVSSKNIDHKLSYDHFYELELMN